MNGIYAESSAVLRWLLGHPDAAALQAALSSASSVVTSALTSLEVSRCLRRLTVLGHITDAERDRVLSTYAAAARHWKVHTISDSVLARAGEAFPIEPVRSLDAIHLATAVMFASEVALAAVLSTDERVRDNAEALGLDVAP